MNVRKQTKRILLLAGLASLAGKAEGCASHGDENEHRPIVQVLENSTATAKFRRRRRLVGGDAAANAPEGCDGIPCMSWEEGENPRSRRYCASGVTPEDVFLMNEEAEKVRNEPGYQRGRRYLAAKKNNDKDLLRGKRNQKYEVPVYFHTIQKDNEGPFLLDVDKTELMRALDKAFSNTNFEFKLKEVTTRKNPKWYACGDPPNGVINTVKKSYHKGHANELHVYFCKLRLLGHSTFPPASRKDVPSDGIVMMYPDAAPYGPLELYWGFVHEVGHWLGLLHTFQDSCKGTPSVKFGFTFARDSWQFAGDGVDDTPAHASPSWDYDGWESCFRNKRLETCRDSNGIDGGLDPVNNYMNYIFEECMRDQGEFTRGQKDRMLLQWLAFRLAPDEELMKMCLKYVMKQSKSGCSCDKAEKTRQIACAKTFISSKCTLTDDTRAVRSREEESVLDDFKKECRF